MSDIVQQILKELLPDAVEEAATPVTETPIAQAVSEEAEVAQSEVAQVHSAIVRATHEVRKPEGCKGCPLEASHEGPVWGVGPKDAKMFLVGEAPGEDEGAALRPFIGGSGRVLSALLAHSRIDRNQVYLTNTVKCRPTAKDHLGRIVNRVPTPAEISHCARYLVGELETVKPNIVVALGNIPHQTITGSSKGVTLCRSVPQEGSKRTDGLAERYKVISTFHPAFVMRQQDFWPVTVFDLIRAKKESATPTINRREWKRYIHADVKRVKEELMRRIYANGTLLKEYGIDADGMYFHDLETTGLDGRKDLIRCTGVSGDDEVIYCFDNTTEFIAMMKEIHANPRLMCVGQNSEGFDIPFQEHKGYEFKGLSFDTLIGFHQLNSSLPKDLAFIGASFTDELPWKDNSMYKAGDDGLQIGCTKDIHATARAAYEELKEMHALQQTDLYFSHIAPVQPVLRKMTKRGLRKDMRAMTAWHLVLNKKADELEARLKKALGADFNVDSPTQLMDLLYKRMGLPVQYTKDAKRGMRPTVDADALDDLAELVSGDPRWSTIAPMLLLVRDIRTLRKWDSTFVMCKHDDEGYVHGHFSTAKAANGRLNSFDPNMQNFPGQVREIMIPDTEEHVFLSRDWSQIEWRIAMTLSGDKNGLDALASGRDAHIDSYSKAFNIEYDKVTKGQRFDAKTINYGLLYGRGEKSLAEGKSGGRSGASRSKAATAIPVERVRSYMAAFLRTFDGYDQMRKEIERQVKQNNFLTSAWGRRRYWYTRDHMPEAYNYPISSAAASMMYEALVQLDRELDKSAQLVLTVHDEVVLVVEKSHDAVKRAFECTKDIMEQPFTKITEASLRPEVVRHYYPNGWFCESDAHLGTNWKMAKCDTKEDEEAEHLLRKQLDVMECS